MHFSIEKTHVVQDTRLTGSSHCWGTCKLIFMVPHEDSARRGRAVVTALASSRLMPNDLGNTGAWAHRKRWVLMLKTYRISTWQLLLVRSWWRHGMDAVSALQTLCVGTLPVPVNSENNGNVKQSFSGFFVVSWSSFWTNGRRHNEHWWPIKVWFP